MAPLRAFCYILGILRIGFWAAVAAFGPCSRLSATENCPRGEPNIGLLHAIRVEGADEYNGYGSSQLFLTAHTGNEHFKSQPRLFLPAF